MELTGIVETVTAASAEIGPALAWTTVAPTFRASSMPLEATSATVVSPLLQATGRLASAVPAESRTVAVSWSVVPTRNETLDGEILTEAARGALPLGCSGAEH